tara:strand:+ start:107967 stop:108647 length:681 start_codon:yes stop_codon:yes gene_type:complete
MAREKKWEQFGPVSFTADGSSEGLITIKCTIGLHTKQVIQLKSDTEQKVNLEVKKVLSLTKFLVGPKGGRMDCYEDVSMFLVSENAVIKAEQAERPKIQPHEIERATFEEEPAVARRSLLVDFLGKPISEKNPLPMASEGMTLDQSIKSGILCAADVNKVFVWATIDCVERIQTITFTSADVDAKLIEDEVLEAGQTIQLVRTYTYQIVDPYNLLTSSDALVIVSP